MSQNSNNRSRPSCALRPSETFFPVGQPLPSSLLEKANQQEKRKMREGMIQLDLKK